MSKTIPVRIYTEEAQLIEQHRRRLTMERGGQRVTTAEAVRSLFDRIEIQQAINNKQAANHPQ